MVCDMSRQHLNELSDFGTQIAEPRRAYKIRNGTWKRTACHMQVHQTQHSVCQGVCVRLMLCKW